MKIFKKFFGFLAISVALMTCSCSNSTQKAVNSAYDALEDGKTEQGISEIQKLMDAPTAKDYTTYDKAYIGLAALVMGAESDSVEIGEKGFALASEAMGESKKECNKAFNDCPFAGDDYENFSEAVMGYHNAIIASQLKKLIIGSWSTSNSLYMFGGSQRNDETLTINPDNTFEQKSVIKIGFVDGDYKATGTGQSSISGKWTLVGDELSLRYDVRTLETSIKSFNLGISSRGSYDFVSSAFRAAAAENGYRKRVDQKLRSELTELYQQAEETYVIEMDEGEMIARNGVATITYSPVNE